MTKVLYTLGLALMVSSLSAQVKFVNEFLNIGVGARAQGMFGSVVASVDDGTAAYWNTAGLTGMKAPLQINAMHANWFGGLSNYDYASIAKVLDEKKNAVGAIGFIRMGIDNIPNTLNLVGPDGSIDYTRVTEFSAADYAFLVSYAQAASANKRLSIGGNVKIIHRNIGSFGSAWGFGTDFSLKYKGDRFSFGVMGRDITTTFNSWTFNLSDQEKAVFAQTGNDIPVSSTEVTIPRIIIGGAYHFKREAWSYLFEVNSNISTNGTEAGVFSTSRFAVDPSFGSEIGYLDRIFLRVGVGNFQRVLNEVNASRRDFELQPNFGLGLKLGRLKIDYALANVGNVSGILSSHIFSLALDFYPGGKKA
jgi:hypothetical protein